MRQIGVAMTYFDGTEAGPERLGKVVGDGLAAFVYLFIAFLMFSVFFR
jgi:hypothetical protein